MTTIQARRHSSRRLDPVFSSLVLFALALFFLVPVAQAASSGQDDAHSRPSHKAITVVIDKDYPPYVFPTSAGDVQGILVDTWKLWEKKTGVPVTLIPMEWNAAQDFMQQGRADVIDTLFQTPEREKTYVFSKPYATIEVPIFVHKDLGGIHDLDSLRGSSVGVKRGDACVNYLSSRGISSLLAFDSYEDVIQAANDGKIKVFCVDKPPAQHYLYRLGLENDFRLAFTLYSGEFHRAVRKGNEALLQLIEDGFSRIAPEQYETINKRWRGVPLFPSTLVHYAVWAVLLVAAAVLVLLTVNALLRRTVRRQTSRLNQLLTAVGQSEERYRELVESAGSVILRLDLLGRVTFCNTFGQRFFGYTLGEMLGRNIANLTDVPGDSASSPWIAPLTDIPNTPADAPETTVSQVMEHQRREGGIIWIAWAMRLLRGAAGEPVEILCVGNDVTERKRAEEALRASEERYALVARGANDGIWDWDMRSNTVYFSPRYIEILGCTPDEMQQMVEEWTKRIHPEDAETVIRENKRCADGEVDNFTVEYRMRHKDGTYRWVLARGASLKDAHGVVLRLAGTHTDITHRKRDEEALRESQDQLSKIFRFSPAGIVISTRLDGRIVDANEACARMIGRTKNEIIGRTSAEIDLWLHPEERETHIADMARRGAIVGREIELHHKNGSTVVALFSSVPNQAYGEACILSVLVDITERKGMEQALRRSKEAAEAANRAKSEFLSTMSHEIRTPMNTILGMTDVLATSALTREQASALKAIELAGSSLLTLLNDILDLSQIEAGGMILEEKACDPVELAGQLVEMMRPDAARKNIDMRLEVLDEIPPRLFCCPDRIRQVLVNLLGNAIKFTEQGQIILAVSREQDPATGPKLRLTVQDTGIGIPLDKQEIIFDRFTQVNASAGRSFGGVGLGLAICKKLTEMMGGHIGVESQLGQGSTFTVTLPLRPAIMSKSTAAMAANPSLPHREVAPPGAVLLIEDSPTNAEVMRLMLEGTNFDLTWAPSGQAALAALRDKPFDIILMDVEMPGMDGYQTTQGVRALEQELGRMRTPIVALTAHAFEEHRQRSLAAGCDDFQVKPIPKSRLLDTLETWMALRPQARNR